LKAVAGILLTIVLWGDLKIPGCIEVQGNPSQEETMAILYTGDGGWRITDRGLAQVLAGQGIPVVAINSLHYFWTRRTIEGTTEDFVRLSEHYLELWKKKKIVLIGYSYGANILPFVLNRLPTMLLHRVEVVALLSPTGTVDFEFHLSQWFSNRVPKNAKPVLPELEKIRGIEILSFCGDQDSESICRDLPSSLAQATYFKGGHVFDKHYREIAEEILKAVKSHGEKSP
jgi:type IV secretory pathway VirJ component